MRICIICSRLCYGGAERVATLWANGFSDREHEVMVVSNLFEPITYKVSNRVILKNLVSYNHGKCRKWLSSFFIVRRYLKDFSPDVVIGVMETCSFVAKVSSLGFRIPIVMTEHYSFERKPYGTLTRIEHFSKFYLNKLYSLVTVLSEADRLVVGKRLKNVQVMPNPLALFPLQKIPNKTNYVLAVGRLDAWKVKGFDVLIKAWGILMKNKVFRKKNSGWRLQIAGTGSEESLNYLKQLCQNYGVGDSVDFLGFVSDMQSLYQKSSVFVLSSRYEGFGLVLIEAMSQGCACVACDYKGRQKEIIQNDSHGLCCEPDNVEALASALKKMLEDEDYRHQVQKKAIERSKYYSLDNTMDHWETLLKEVVKK